MSDDYEDQHFIEKLVRESEHCVLCDCKGDCPGGCTWIETALCSSCWGERCILCEVVRSDHPTGICFKCLREAERIAHGHAGFRLEDAERERYRRYVKGLEPGRAMKDPDGKVFLIMADGTPHEVN